MGSASKKASSLVVAASMAAVEALKDQVGLCRWDYALRSLYHRAAAATVPLSKATAGTAAWPAGGAKPGWPAEEKLKKAYHLLCWGPS